eukprot:TRINITY_DN20064_c0_g1_i1.p1 TRINITY_DN20064_c0_g1~~TRINITY_DN20064_c0_g1_i1.p1  ORF type:complete len:482 (+),score=97.11 TRINITY_DN20064_c0_g1_i1:64-1446(+)
MRWPLLLLACASGVVAGASHGSALTVHSLVHEDTWVGSIEAGGVKPRGARGQAEDICASLRTSCQHSLDNTDLPYEIRSSWEDCHAQFCSCRPSGVYHRYQATCYHATRRSDVCMVLEVCYPARSWCQRSVRRRALSYTAACRAVLECEATPEYKQVQMQKCVQDFEANFPSYPCNFTTACTAMPGSQDTDASMAQVVIALSAGIPVLIGLCCSCCCAFYGSRSYSRAPHHQQTYASEPTQAPPPRKEVVQYSRPGAREFLQDSSCPYLALPCYCRGTRGFASVGADCGKCKTHVDEVIDLTNVFACEPDCSEKGSQCDSASDGGSSQVRSPHAMPPAASSNSPLSGGSDHGALPARVRPRATFDGLKGSSVEQPASAPRRALCAVCLEGQCQVLLMPCMHLAACVECAGRIAASEKCHLCRAPIRCTVDLRDVPLPPKCQQPADSLVVTTEIVSSAPDA